MRTRASARVPTPHAWAYAGLGRGSRRFDILVEGGKIATQGLNQEKGNEFFDVSYPISGDVTRGKEKVTVRLQPAPNPSGGRGFGGGGVGPLYGAMTLRKE